MVGQNEKRAQLNSEQVAFDSSPRVTADGGFLPPMVSYAQNFEDVILRRVLQDVEAGFYVDIGAYDPRQDSVTRWFYDTGWSGINVEPNAKLYEHFEEARPRDRNLQLVIAGASGRRTFYLVANAGMSTLDPETAELHARAGIDTTHAVEVEAITLDDLLETYGQARTVDFLKIDAEGAEPEIILAARFAEQRPRVILIEATRPMSQLPAWHDWEPYLLSRGYGFAVFDGLNRFYVREEDAWRRPRFALPACVFDNFCIAGLLEAQSEVTRLHGAVEAVGVALEAERCEGEQVAARAAAATAAHVAQVGLLRSEVDAGNADNQRLRDALAAAARREADQCSELTAAARREADQRSELTAASGRSAALERDLAAGAVREASLHAALAAAAEREASLHAALAAATADKASLQVELQGCKRSLRKVKHSRSWRVTRPLRALRRIFKWRR